MSARAINLAESQLLEGLDPEQTQHVINMAERCSFPTDSVVLSEHAPSDGLYVVLSGQARIYRGELSLSLLQPGCCFGELGLLSGQPRSATIKAVTPLVVARIKRTQLERLAVSHPAAADLLIRNVAARIGDLLREMTDTVSALLQARARPLRTRIEVRLPDGPQEVGAGTPISQLLPSEIDGYPVIAALLDRKPTVLNAPIYASARIEPVVHGQSTVARAIYRHSVGLLLLEAAARLDPDLSLHIGASLGFGHLVEVVETPTWDKAQLLIALTEEMQRLVEENTPFRRERWSLEEARAEFEDQGWMDAVRLLRSWRDSTVPLISCGEIYALDTIAAVPSTGYLQEFELIIHAGDLLLRFGDEEPRFNPVRTAATGRLARAHQHWLKALSITDVGAFNERSIQGSLTDIIRISEGFHEKRISEIADEIATSPRQIRVICISGPSSSGKTTFIERLSVQLQVNGLDPVTIGMDDFYLDRERTPRDERGEYDFEAFEALDVALLKDQLSRLINGETVQTARFDFKRGKSLPEGGRVLTIGPRNVLMLEGIHALNPKLPVGEDGVFRIFINPLTSLPLDHVSRVSVSDLRLLRRIVRDRHGRATTAADNIMRWPSVRRGERRHIFPHQQRADAVFNSSLIYEPAVLKVYAERYLLEVPDDHPAQTVAIRLRRLIDHFVAIYPDQVPPTSLLKEFIGGQTF